MDTHTPIRLLTARQVYESLGVCRSTLDALRASGKFPKPIKVGRQLRWRVDDVEAWLAAQ